MLLVILQKVLDISHGEVADETVLNILNFLRDNLILVVVGGLGDESLVKDTFKEKIEIRHESGIVTELVLLEDGVKSHVDFLSVVTLTGGLAEVTPLTPADKSTQGETWSDMVRHGEAW